MARRPLKVVVAAVPVVQARVRVKAVVDSAVVVRAKAVRAVLVPANGVITVRVRAVPHKAAALAVDSVAAKAAATTSRAAEPRAMVPHAAVRGGRGGTAGAFGRQGGKSSKARKNRLAKRHEYEELKAPTIGGVRIPNGNGQTIRLRQGASLADLAEKINVNQAALVTVLFHLGQMATATSPWTKRPSRSWVRKSAGTSSSFPPRRKTRSCCSSSTSTLTRKSCRMMRI